MGTQTVAPTSTALVLNQVVEYLAPSGAYELRKIALKNEYAAIVASAAKITAITSEEEAQEAANHGRLLQAGLKEIETFIKPVKSKIDSIKNPVLADEKALGNPLDAEKKRLGVLLTGWNQEVERRRQVAQREAEEAARKQAEEDALQRAIELAAAGEDEAADAVLSEPVVAAPVVVQAQVSKPTGSVGRKYYKAKVNNLKALVEAVAVGKVSILALTANQSWLNDEADHMKEAFAIPGCELETTTSTSFRA